MKNRTIEERNRSYGFLPEADAPVPSEPFAVTGDFTSCAKNHCCAVTVTNLVLQGYTGNGWRTRWHNSRELFMEIHRFVGNGPVFRLGSANRFLKSAGLKGAFEKVSKADLVPALKAGHPAALLVAASPFDWHWVLAIAPAAAGPAGPASAVRIINNWERRQWKIYVPGRGSRLLAVWVFR